VVLFILLIIVGAAYIR
ncbi:YjcZ family sporulation protein, partial [Bacillus sp. JJ1521]